MSTFDDDYQKALAAAGPKRRAQAGTLIKAPKHDPEILAGIPSGVWADLWATEQEEKGRSFSGRDIMDEAPSPPAWAKKWGKKIADEIVSLNGGKSLEDLYQLAKGVGYTKDRSTFGYHLGMQSVGHGVGWADDADYRKVSSGRDLIKLPRTEFYRP